MLASRPAGRRLTWKGWLDWFGRMVADFEPADRPTESAQLKVVTLRSQFGPTVRRPSFKFTFAFAFTLMATNARVSVQLGFALCFTRLWPSIHSSIHPFVRSFIHSSALSFCSGWRRPGGWREQNFTAHVMMLTMIIAIIIIMTTTTTTTVATEVGQTRRRREFGRFGTDTSCQW